MYSQLVRPSAYLGAAGVVSFFPLFVAVYSGIWIPTAMVQETFTTNFMALAVGNGYLSVPVGHAQLALFSYPAIVINKLFFADLSLFEQFQTFSYVWHIWSGLLLFLALAIAIKAPLFWRERVLLLLVPLMVPMLLRTSNLGLMISYDRAETLAVIGLAVPLMLWMRDHELTKEQSFYCGAVLAFATTTKLSFGAILSPLIVIMCYRQIWALVAGGLTTSILIYYAAFLGNGRHFLKQAKNMVGYFKESLIQREGTIILEFQKVLSLESWYFGLQLVLLLTTIALAIVAKRRPLFFAAAILCIALEVFVLTKRLSLSAMFDVVAITTLLLIVCLAYTNNKVLIAAVVLAVLTTPLFYDYGGVFRNLAHNSAEAARLQEALPDNGIVYYHDDFKQQLIFPDPHIMLATLFVSPEHPGMQDLRHIRFNQSPSEILSDRHTAVIPEFLTPNAIQPMKITATIPYGDCQVFQFKEPQTSITHYYYYNVRVTVCDL